MEMILISANKLKIILSKGELERFDLTTDMLDYGNTETKRMLWDILSRAKHSIGFDPDGYRVFVQLYPSKDGSCELFVTKIGTSDASICDIFSPECKECEARDINPYEYALEDEECEEKTASVFEMDSLEALCEACRRLIDVSFSGKSSVYIFNGIFYLLIFCDTPRFCYPLDELSFLGEYGKPNHSKELLLNIYEFGKSLCEGNAIKIFSEL